MLIERRRSQLLVVDVQERLLPVMHDADAVIRGATLLIEGARRLDVPVLASEQYPRGLGPTVEEIRRLVPDDAVLEKLAFSCAADPGVRDRVGAADRPEIVVCGIEAHVCVLQTALGFAEAGYRVFVVGDAISSRSPHSVAAAKERLGMNGVAVVTCEMVLFEWLAVAGTPEFKDLSRLIK